MIIDGIEVVKDPWLRNAKATNAHLWAFLLHIPDWELRIHPARNFKLMPFTWQGDQANGLDAWISRVLLAGNLVCWAPNRSLHHSALT
jgi:hypothetical protein